MAYVETLTGFKWIARAARRRPGHRLLFGYEEALGYAVTTAVADKDGMSAALVVADMVARAKHEGRSLLDRLDELEATSASTPPPRWSLRLPGSDAPAGPRRPDGAVALGAPGAPGRPRGDRCAGPGRGGRRTAALGRPGPADWARAGRVVLRPSGTEPKLKVYLEATTGPCAAEDLGEARREARARLEDLRRDVVGLVETGDQAASDPHNLYERHR